MSNLNKLLVKDCNDRYVAPKCKYIGSTVRKHRADLIVMGICFVLIVCGCFVICLQCRNASAFSFVCFNE